MRYPELARAALGAVPVPLNVDQRRSRWLVACLDRVFDPGDDAAVRVDGALIAVDLKSQLERLLYYAPANVVRSHRRAELCTVIERLPPGGLFVDVGANLGLFSLLARQRGLEALLFEPEPLHLRFLRRNESVFGQVSGWALSDEEGQTELFVADLANPGASSLVRPTSEDEEAIYAATAVVEVTTFDAAMERLGVVPESIALVKIDVEGNEERTVRGMQRTLRRYPPPIWCEVRGPTSARGRASFEAVVRLLAQHGYVAYRSTGGQLSRFYGGAALPEVFDLLFLRETDPLPPPARRQAR